MVAEIQQRPPAEDEKVRESKPNSDVLRPDAKSYQDFNKQINSRNASESPMANGSLIVTPINELARRSDKTKPEKYTTDKTADGSVKPENATDRTSDTQSRDANFNGDGAKEPDGSEAKPNSDVAGRPEGLNPKPIEDNTDGIELQSAISTDNAEIAEPQKLEQPKTGDAPGKPEKPENPVAKIDEKEKIILAAETQKAKDDFVKIMHDRWQDDPRAQQNPDFIKDLDARMDQMDQLVLHQRVKCEDGSFINQQEQLAEKYRNLSRIGTDAENLTYKGADGKERQVYSQPWMVNNILASAVIRGADPIHAFNQGANNTCAAEAINRQGTLLLAGEESKTLADMVTTGQFQTVDQQGKQITCTVDKASLVLDRQAQSIYTSPRDARDAYGQLADVRSAQANLSLIGRDIARSEGRNDGGENDLEYRKVAPEDRRDTGERIVDTRTGKVIANSPLFSARTESWTKQALFGRFIDKDFGKETSLVSNRAYDVENATRITSSEQLLAAAKNLEAKGWELSSISTHVGHYIGGAEGLSGTEGWHLTSFNLNKEGKLDFINNWGGAHNYSKNADEIFGWMHAPVLASAADRRRGDHIFDPGGARVFTGGNELGKEINKDSGKVLAQDANNTRNKEDELLAQLRKAQQQKEEESTQKHSQYARAQLAQIEAQLTTLSENDSQRASLIARRQLYEQNFKLT